MITIYCSKNHQKGRLCEDCTDLSTYTYSRIDRCPYIGEKTFCSSCPTPCYNGPYQDRIRDVMRFSAPRMLFYNPILLIKYIFDKYFN